ncbi:MAG: hypothetical protein JSW46_07995 [Gemmatimonadota bacterium]|nr:MAG: hypothetical protein JSW46_07995 [Gemmatimonadota bacterium]
MGRAIGSVVVGYVVMAVVIMISFTLAWLALGADGSFEPGTYEVSAVCIVMSIVVGLLAAMLGGFVCSAVAKRATPPKVLAAIVLVLGLGLAIPELSGDQVPAERPAEVSMTEANTNAEQPVWLALLNPLIGAVGVLAGARLKNRSQGGSLPA